MLWFKGGPPPQQYVTPHVPMLTPLPGGVFGLGQLFDHSGRGRELLALQGHTGISGYWGLAFTPTCLAVSALTDINDNIVSRVPKCNTNRGNRWLLQPHIASELQTLIFHIVHKFTAQQATLLSKFGEQCGLAHLAFVQVLPTMFCTFWWLHKHSRP